jgi:UDP-N-acetyl-D-mannosaminuronic acid dehydrogenase
MTLERSEIRSLYGSGADPEQRRRWLRNGEVPVAVYGLGKMGLPLAAVYAETTGSVTGVDIDSSVVDAVNQGRSPVANEPGLARLVARSVAGGDLWATSDPTAAAAASSVHVIIVPTTLAEDRSADLSALRSALHSVGAGLSAGDLVVVESTVPPGTCEDLAVPLLERESGLSLGEFGLAFCPERTASGRALEDIRSSYPKVVGGVDDESTATAGLIYGEITENRVISVADARTAECVKLFEGVYRDVNIALANELARFADDLGVDTIATSEVANTQPFCEIHEPGAGVGGHCIPFYPHFLMQVLEADAPLLGTARGVNDSMPAFTASKLLEGLSGAGIDPRGATVAVLGVAYRAGVAETRASPAFPIIDRLTAAGVSVVVVDPILEDVPDLDVPLTALEDLQDRDIDGAILVTAHRQFETIDWSGFRDLVVVDGRDALDLAGTGHAVYTVGRGT